MDANENEQLVDVEEAEPAYRVYRVVIGPDSVEEAVEVRDSIGRWMYPDVNAVLFSKDDLQKLREYLNQQA